MKVALKEQYKTLAKDEKRIVRKSKVLSGFAMALALVVLCFCSFVGSYLFNLIPLPSWWLWKTLVIIGKIIILIALLIVSPILTFICVSPLLNKIESLRLPTIRKEIFSKACGHLREYYQLEEPYVLTKCFDSSDERFKNRDVCIFMAYDELRITTDLVKGFLHGDRDLGCYAFTRDEITLSKKQSDKGLILELKAGDTFFLLGYRAKGFIVKNFIPEQSK